jgi:exodeoxyribonuclease V alpha subunit
MSIGFAKALFFATHQRTPWKTNEISLRKSTWPLLNDLLSKQKISYLDYTLTLKLLQLSPTTCQEVAICICHLLMSAKAGHLCIKVENGQVFPPMEQVWQQDNGRQLETEEQAQITQMVCQGAEALPISLVSEIKENRYLSTPICRSKSLLYLQRHWLFESLIAYHLQKQNHFSPKFHFDLEALQSTVKAWKEEGKLLEEQAQAIINSLTSSFSLINGGPGTGKTYTAGYLIKAFWKHLSAKGKKHVEIALAAPTGKAAANLQSSLARVTADLIDFPSLSAKTLHNLLGIKRSPSLFKDRAPFLSADLIIIDEGSMIDVRLMALLLSAIKKGARLVLLGDQYQLPSVEAGSLFNDFIYLAHQSSNHQITCTTLKTCLRAELKSIIEFAARVNRGEAQQAMALLNHADYPGLYHKPLPSDKSNGFKTFYQEVCAHFPSFIPEENNPSHLLALFKKTGILSPLRKGPWGVDQLNLLLWQKISRQAPKKGWMAIPIMIVANDYQNELFNGEMGVLMRKLPVENIECTQMDDYALFPGKDKGENVRRFSALLLPRYELAYCLSVHKSQGSEFEHVFLVMPEGSELFGREVFYTAVTRARKKLDLFGSEHILMKTISQQGMRFSGLSAGNID